MADVEKIKLNGSSLNIKDANAVSVESQSLTAQQKTQARENIGAASVDSVPTSLAELSDDSTHRLITDTEKTTWNSMIPSTAKGASNGVAELDSNGKVPSSQLPSFVDDVIEGYYSTLDDRFYEESTFTTLIEPVAGKSWVDIPANKSYRWTGSVYVRVDEGVQIGETSDTAYAGNKGKANADAIAAINEVIPSTATSQNPLATEDDIPTDAVKYTAQTLTDAQKTQARTNIGAGTSDFSGSYSNLTNAPPLAKGHGISGDIEGGTNAYTTFSNSFAYGYNANAMADYAFAFGLGVNASRSNEVAFGKYNVSNPDTAFSIGDGSGYGATSNHNLMELKTDGRMFLNGNETAIKNDIDAVNKRCDDIIDIIEDKTVIYGFHVNPDESDPADAVTYLADAVGMTPAAMGTTSFDYGSWKDAFFMPRPCMLKYDGTVDYYLDPNDYSKKLDGTASDISDYSYNGNAMMEFPKIWFKFESGAAEGEGYFYVSNKQVDSSYHCWTNYDADSNQIDHFYMAIYNGVTYDGKMRSLSGKKLSPWSTAAYSSSATYAVDSIVNYNNRMWKCVTAVETAEEFDPTKWEQFGFNGNTDGQQEVDAAVANDTTAKSEWYIDTWCDRVVITALLYLMGKSLDLQSTYGRGIDSGGQSAAENYVTGTADDKGLFYGDTANGDSVVKVFGIENFWACKWRRTAGCIGINNGKVAYKMTSSTADGSTATAYNTDGTGYLIDNTVRPSNGYVRKMGFGNWGLMPRSITGGNSNVYYCDYFYTNNSATTFARVGGYSYDSLSCGFYVYLSSPFAVRSWGIAAVLSCKPLANKG